MISRLSLNERVQEWGPADRFGSIAFSNARVTEDSFAPRYATQVGVGAFSGAGPPATSRSRMTRWPARSPSTRTSRAPGPRHVVQCSVCQKRFYRSRYDTRLRAHKAPDGWQCHGRLGMYLGTTE
jgi:hypothetical protein